MCKCFLHYHSLTFENYTLSTNDTNIFTLNNPLNLETNVSISTLIAGTYSFTLTASFKLAFPIARVTVIISCFERKQSSLPFNVQKDSGNVVLVSDVTTLFDIKPPCILTDWSLYSPHSYRERINALKMTPLDPIRLNTTIGTLETM